MLNSHNKPTHHMAQSPHVILAAIAFVCQWPGGTCSLSSHIQQNVQKTRELISSKSFFLEIISEATQRIKTHFSTFFG